MAANAKAQSYLGIGKKSQVVGSTERIQDGTYQDTEKAFWATGNIFILAGP